MDGLCHTLPPLKIKDKVTEAAQHEAVYSQKIRVFRQSGPTFSLQAGG